MFNLFIASPGESTCEHALSGAVVGPLAKKPGLLIRAQLVEAALPSPAGWAPSAPGGARALPLLVFAPSWRPGSTDTALVSLRSHSGVTRFRKPHGDHGLLASIHELFSCYLDKAVLTCVLYTVLLLLL